MSTPDPADSSYVHGSHPDEQQRLSLLNGLLNDVCLRELRLRGGERVLDVGSGLGQFSRAMARVAARVLGIERDPGQLARAHALAHAASESHLAEFRQGDALALPLLPGEAGHFDLIHSRFLLEHLRDPLGAVREMARAARSGGRIVLADDDHDILRLNPEPPGFAPLWVAYQRCYDRLGNDPWIGRRLTSLLHAAGARPTRVTTIPFGSCAGDPHFPVFAANLIGVIGTARERMVEMELIEASAFDFATGALREWKERPDAAIWYSMCWAEGIV